MRFIPAILSFILRNVISGALFTIGATLIETLRKKGIPMLRTPKLLFHPHITMIAALTCLASFCTLIASLAIPLHRVPFIGAQADNIVGTAMVIGPVALWVATYGRSPASAVDNNTQK